jgi:hypothetical protein
MKKILILILVLAAVGGAAYWYMNMKPGTFGNSLPASEKAASQQGASQQVPEMPGGDQAGVTPKPETFSGKLETVNKGCVGKTSGECYIVVDGKHVTYVMNMPADLIGQIIGVPTYLDLEGKIGQDVEVYAQKKADGAYSLYGSSKFYIKLK